MFAYIKVKEIRLALKYVNMKDLLGSVCRKLNGCWLMFANKLKVTINDQLSR